MPRPAPGARVRPLIDLVREDRALSVREAFEQERPRLLALPETPFPSEEQVAVTRGQDALCALRSATTTRSRTPMSSALSVCVATLHAVRVLDGAEVIATHARSFDAGQQIEDAAHLAALVERKRQARTHRGQDRLAQAVPNSRTLLVQAGERGENLGSITAALLRLLDTYGASELEAAIDEALAREVPASQCGASGLATPARAAPSAPAGGGDVAARSAST